MIRCLGSSLCSFATIGSQQAPLLAAALLQFDTYLRPGDISALNVGHVLSPVHNAGVAYRRWELSLQFVRLPSLAPRSLALKMTPSSLASPIGFGLWIFCGHYILGVPLPRTRFSVAHSCSDMNKGSTMPALLWVLSGFMQRLTRFATPDLLKMLFTDDQTWPPSRNGSLGFAQVRGAVPNCFASFLLCLNNF